ncbi:MAG: hypothetical protein PWP27_180 [Clostridiales bacterium]|nr:hypothetical protein [Clostridiales bacterium]
MSEVKIITAYDIKNAEPDKKCNIIKDIIRGNLKYSISESDFKEIKGEQVPFETERTLDDI